MLASSEGGRLPRRPRGPGTLEEFERAESQVGAPVSPLWCRRLPQAHGCFCMCVSHCPRFWTPGGTCTQPPAGPTWKGQVFPPWELPPNLDGQEVLHDEDLGLPVPRLRKQSSGPRSPGA